jgi:hypothetical protein
MTSTSVIFMSGGGLCSRILRRRARALHCGLSVLWFYLIFLVFLKIPIVYLCYVVWWAVKDPPQPGEGYAGAAGEAGSDGPDAGSWWRRLRRPGPRSGPHGSPIRRPQTAVVRARSEVTHE